MYKPRIILVLTMVFSSYFSGGQSIAPVSPPAGIAHPKFENGLIITWKGVSADPNENQVEIFDEHWNPLARLKVLKPVPEARRVSISDVSARRDKLIVVAAVFGSKEGNKQVRPAASLLHFDFGSQLLSAFSLAPSRKILRLTLDENLNVWTITAHADDKDPSTVPMVVEYSGNGNVKRDLLPRSTFPFDAASTQENSAIGSTFMGYAAGSVWFWLPGSTNLVSIPTAPDGTPSIVTLGVSNEWKGAVPRNVLREPSGKVIAEIRKDNYTKDVSLAYYEWSPASKLWEQYKPGDCNGGWLIGIDGRQQVYDGQNNGGICRFQNPREVSR